MLDFEAIDAKINRARGESRSLKTDIVAFCEEKARLIVPENHGEEVWWVYRGDDPNPPIDWSVRVGEFAYNLRSSLGSVDISPQPDEPILSLLSAKRKPG